MTTLIANYNGKTFTRNTDRNYQFAIGVTDAVLKPWSNDRDGIVAWCGDFAKAQAAAKKYNKPQFGFSCVQVVEVQQLV